MIGNLAAIALGLVFIFAAVAKVRTSHWAVMAIDSGTPRALIIGLPAFEALLGLALVFQLGRPVVPFVAVAVLIAFTAVLTYRTLTSSKVPCNCFGGNSNDPVDKVDIARNLLLVGVALVAALA